MTDNRIRSHPVLPIEEKPEVTFYWNGAPLTALRGEMIATALFANGIRIFGHHHKDKSALGIFCANGQCAKCTVIANGKPVKSCMTAVQENMFVQSLEGLPSLPEVENSPDLQDIKEVKTQVLIIGGGPAGLSAALQLAEQKINAILVDDKEKLGGKLVLQTHKFFGSVADSQAGMRGNAIGSMLAEQVMQSESIDVWTNSTAIFAFSDKKVGILKDGEYRLVTPEMILNTAGAREKFLRFPGNHLAGIYGAGAFQTLVNRDLVRPTQRLFIIGGGNVGLIAGYHALQAGIDVVGLVEALPQCGGYKVHADKLKRLGVPIYTSHTILSANGAETVESITIAAVDDQFRPLPGTEKSFTCDTILIAVGLEPISEFTESAKRAGVPVFAAGDAAEIAEASSAMFNGKIAGLEVAGFLGKPVPEVPQDWYEKAAILKAHPGKIECPEYMKDLDSGIFPVIHCCQEIPCNPCGSICPTNSILLKNDPIMGIPVFEGKCIGCGECVRICPGLAITLVDYRLDAAKPLVTIPWEISTSPAAEGDLVRAVDINGDDLGNLEVVKVMEKTGTKTQLVKVLAPASLAKRIAGIRIQPEAVSKPLAQAIKPDHLPDEALVCVCERVTAGEVRALIRQGISDLNQIKAITRAGMGPCGAKTCTNLMNQLLREEGVQSSIANTRRPAFVEIPLGILAGSKEIK